MINTHNNNNNNNNNNNYNNNRNEKPVPVLPKFKGRLAPLQSPKQKWKPKQHGEIGEKVVKTNSFLKLELILKLIAFMNDMERFSMHGNPAISCIK